MTLSGILGKENVAAFAYVLGPVSGLILLALEKDEFVRFHSWQSIFVLGPMLIFVLLLGFTNYFAYINQLLSLLLFVSWLVLIYKAWQGDEFVFPFLGGFAKKIASK